jgi:hypothetical protein
VTTRLSTTIKPTALREAPVKILGPAKHGLTMVLLLEDRGPFKTGFQIAVDARSLHEDGEAAA